MIDYLDEVNQFSTKYLAEAVDQAKKEKKKRLEHLIKNKVEFALKFESASKTFYNLVFRKTESQLRTIQEQLSHQKRIFVRIEVRRQGREFLPCQYKNRFGCLGDYQYDNCQVNYSVVADNQITEISK